MNKVQQSLKDNLEEIKKNLPEEFHANLDATIENASESAHLSGDAAATAMKNEITYNPQIDENDAELGEFKVEPAPAHDGAPE